jgi:hypothetical protein
VDEPERQQHDEPAQEEQRAPLALCKPLELNGKACAENSANAFKSTASVRMVSTALSIDEKDKGGLGNKNRSKIETRNMVTTFIATTPSKARPRNTSMASIRSVGLIGRGDAAPSEAIAI